MQRQPISVGAALRRLALFHLKLLADTLRDLVLSPVSFLAILLDIVLRNPSGDTLFERLMRFGHRSDEFINLFGVEDAQPQNIDGVIQRAESARWMRDP